MDDLITVIVPIFNCSKYLKLCVDSIINQTYENIEIILVNDGSTDNSYDICKELASKDKRIKIYTQKNKGVSSARNLGIKNASGKYICFVDSDDTIRDNMIEKLYNNIIKYNVDMSICNYYEVIKDKYVFNNNYKPFIIKKREDYHKNIDIYNGFLWNKMYKSSIIKQIKMNEDIHFCEDELFNTKYVELAMSFYYDNTPLYNYYKSGNSASSFVSINSKKLSILNARELIIDILKKYDFSVYKRYYLSHYRAINELSHRINLDNKWLNKRKAMYKVIMKSNEFSIKEKLKIFIKHRLYFIYKIYHNIMVKI